MKYVHGYNKKEKERLFDQAATLEELLHNGTFFKKGDLVLEAGCGVGEIYAEAINRLRSGKVHIKEGFDGEFGRIKVFSEKEIEKIKGKSYDS